MRKKIKIIVFDFDGVLVDTFEMHYQNIINHLIPNMTREDLRSLFDGNFYAQLEKKKEFLKIDELDSLTEKSMNDNHLVKGLLPFLENSSLDTFIISSNGERPLKRFLSEYDMLRYFKKVLGAETHKSKVEKFKLIFKEENSRPEELLFITDTLGDIKEARELGITVIAVTWGFHPKERLEKGKPEYLVESPKECVELLELLTESESN
jgi:phosphoglycolate phosphatase